MNEKKGLDGYTLKIIAIISMFIDHIGASIIEKGVIPKVCGKSVADAGLSGLHTYNLLHGIDIACRLIGRIAFPIFLFLLIEGLIHTKDIKKYILRLFAFALISEVPFDLAMYGKWFSLEGQNVIFTLLIGLLVIWGMRYFEENGDWSVTLRYASEAVVVLVGSAIAILLKTDYSWKGILALAVMFFFSKDKKKQIIGGAIAFAWEITAPLAFIPIAQYNGEKGGGHKYFFYIFYPAHLFLFGLLVKFCF